jgi:7-cyano-7-deazaguanine synthase in queuosine biosynthesis
MELIYVNSTGETSKVCLFFAKKKVANVFWVFASYENRCAVPLLGVARSWSSGFGTPFA